MGPKGSQRETSRPTPLISYNFCQSCSCQRCRKIQAVGRCINCKCDDCVDVLPSHNYHSSDETSDEKISGNEEASEKSVLSKSFVTPQKRITIKSLSSQQKEAVRDAACTAAPELEFSEAESLGFCLVSLLNDYSTSLQTCHVIAQNVVGKDNVMMMLEYSWGYKYHGLNLHSRYNMMNLEASLHLSFDRGHWALLPLDVVHIKKLSRTKFTIKNPIEEMYSEEEQSFRYAFLPFPTMKRPIMRLGNNDLTQDASTTNPVTVHYPPYDQLPILHSHVKPHFVIWNLVTKLRESQIDIRTLPEALRHHNRRTLGIIVSIYDRWTVVKVPPSFRERKVFATNSDSEENGEGSSSKGNELGPVEGSHDEERKIGSRHSVKASSSGRYQTRSVTFNTALNIATSEVQQP